MSSRGSSTRWLFRHPPCGGGAESRPLGVQLQPEGQRVGASTQQVWGVGAGEGTSHAGKMEATWSQLAEREAGKPSPAL